MSRIQIQARSASEDIYVNFLEHAFACASGMYFLAAIILLGYTATAFAEQPNVILIVTDDQGYGDMSCHGNPWLQTPNLDRLAKQSVSLNDYHVDPYCTPTRAALLTGRYSLRTGAWHVIQGRQLMYRDEVTLADTFKASGYTTAMFGKWHLGDNYPYAPQYRGFDHVVCHKAGGVDEIGNPHGNDYFDDTYFRNGKPEKFQGYCTDVWFNELTKFVCNRNEESKKPFFAYLALNAMHSPFTVDEKYSSRFIEKGLPRNRSIFFGMIENFDENLGRLIKELEDSKLAENTIVIFMGDNGTAAGAKGPHGLKDGFNAGMRGWKGQMYDGGHRVACFARWPGKFVAGKKVESLTAHIDWFPTLIELCDLQQPEKVKHDGASFASMLTDKKVEGPADRTLFVEQQRDQIKQHDVSTPKGNIAVLTERWRLVNGELYDINTDTGQENNLSKQHPDVVTDLAARHSEWFKDVTSHKGKYARFVVGDAKENPTNITDRDWHPTKGYVVWEPKQLADDKKAINGFWELEVVTSGKYQIKLSRYPPDNPQPMKTTKARVDIGGKSLEIDCDVTDASATFEVDLKKGPARLQTWLTDAETKSNRGAYFVTVTALPPVGTSTNKNK